MERLTIFMQKQQIINMEDLIKIGKFTTTKVDGSVTYTETEIWQGEVRENDVFVRTVETGYHNGGSTVRTTEKYYPKTVLSAFTGIYIPETGMPEINMDVLGNILQTFGITLV